MTITIRPEQPQDIAAISAITQAAFIDHPHSQQTEHLIIDALRTAGALTISLVAERDGEIIGHIVDDDLTRAMVAHKQAVADHVDTGGLLQASVHDHFGARTSCLPLRLVVVPGST